MMNQLKIRKKNNITEKIIEKEKKVLLIAILSVITLFIGTSYSLLINFDQTEDIITFQTGNLNMSVSGGDSISIANKLPESDQDGLNNATPISLTFTNTGTITVGSYDVKLITDQDKTSTLSDDYIKYAISTDGVSYSEPSILSETSNVIYTNSELLTNNSNTIYLKLWIDENAGTNALNKDYYGSISVDLNQIDGTLSGVFKNVLLTRTSTTIIEDGITYISGAKDDDNSETTDDVDYNYVWYSGKMWRIIAINADGSLKLITQDNITSIAYGSDVNFYTDESTNSWIYQWLNQDFLDTLYNYENIIVTDSAWNVTSGDGTISTKLAETTMVSASVGLLNSYEYYKSYQSASYSSGYLNIGYLWFLITPYNSSNTDLWYVSSNGGGGSGASVSRAIGVRPSVNLKSKVELRGGTGTKTDPYLISGDKEEAVADTTFLNTRQSGEYVNFDGELYRIVEIENNKTKLNKMDYVRDETDSVITKAFSSSDSYVTYGGSGTTDETYWAGYLNNTWKTAISDEYENMLVEGTYYLGVHDYFTNGYKISICSTESNTITTNECEKTTSTWTGFIGLPRYGEMFATQQGIGSSNSSDMWLITPISSSSFFVWYVYNDGYALDGYTPNSYATRPSIHLSSSVKITSGTGLPNDPYEIGMA